MPNDLILFTFSWATLLQFLLAIVLPLIVAVVTRRFDPGIKKATILAALTVVTTILTAILGAITTDVPVDLFSVLVTALGSFVISVATYAGFWDSSRTDKPSIAASIQSNVGVR